MYRQLTIKYLKTIGLTTSEAKVISLLLEEQKPVTQTEIHLRTRLSTGSISSSLKKAIREKIVTTQIVESSTVNYYTLTKTPGEILTTLYLNKMIKDQEGLLEFSKNSSTDETLSAEKNRVQIETSIQKNLEYTKRIKSLIELEKQISVQNSTPKNKY